MNDSTGSQEGAAGTAIAEPRPDSGTTKRLVRRSDRKMVAGVAAGVADYTGLDVALVRVGFVLLAVFSGIGLIAYAAGWVLLPPSDDPDAAPAIQGSSATGWIGIALIVSAASLLVHELGFVRDDIFWPLLLIGVGVALWTTSTARRDETTSPDGPPSGSHPVGGPSSPLVPRSPSPSTFATDPASSDVGAALATLVPAAGAGRTIDPAPVERATQSRTDANDVTTVPVAPAPTPRRERSILGRLTLGAAVLALGVGLLLHNLGVVDLTVRAVLAGTLVVVGCGLVVGGWWGRARWLILPGALVAAALLLSNFAAANFDPAFGPRHLGWRMGDETWRPASAEELRSSYRMLGGRMVLDLSAIDRVRRGTHVDVRLGAGEMVVEVPPGLAVDVTASAEAGEVDVFGERSNGIEVRRRYTDEPFGSRASPTNAMDGGPLVINAHVGLGEVHVERRSAAADQPTSERPPHRPAQPTPAPASGPGREEP